MMMILYILLSCVLLLNMLIGILSSTFDMVKENCDVEWKFARSQLLKVSLSSNQTLNVVYHSRLLSIVDLKNFFLLV